MLGFEVVEIRGCYKDKPGESKFTRWLKVNTYERLALGSSFYLIARKPGDVGTLVKAEISAGELLDKITILEIKSERIKEPAKLDNVNRELGALRAAQANVTRPGVGIEKFVAELKAVNEKIWGIEDDIREHERRKDFGPSFIALARSVYQTNDARAAIKKKINLAIGSNLVEEKSYAEY